MESLLSPEGGLAAVFAASFIAASVVPLSSEAVLFGYLKLHPEHAVLAVALATLGNTAGGMTTYLIGRLFPEKRKLSERTLRKVRRYGAAAVVGAIPALVFNAWAFGDPLQFAYGDAVAQAGFSGHFKLGLNDDGLFGITVPTPAKATDLLVSSRGLLTLTPVLAMAVVGIWLIGKRREWVTEARVLGAVCVELGGAGVLP